MKMMERKNMDICGIPMKYAFAETIINAEFGKTILEKRKCLTKTNFLIFPFKRFNVEVRS